MVEFTSCSVDRFASLARALAHSFVLPRRCDYYSGHRQSVRFHVFDLACSIGADVLMPDPTAPSCIECGWHEAKLKWSVSSPSGTSMS